MDRDPDYDEWLIANLRKELEVQTAELEFQKAKAEKEKEMNLEDKAKTLITPSYKDLKAMAEKEKVCECNDCKHDVSHCGNENDEKIREITRKRDLDFERINEKINEMINERTNESTITDIDDLLEQKKEIGEKAAKEINDIVQGREENKTCICEKGQSEDENAVCCCFLAQTVDEQIEDIKNKADLESHQLVSYTRDYLYSPGTAKQMRSDIYEKAELKIAELRKEQEKAVESIKERCAKHKIDACITEPAKNEVFEKALCEGNKTMNFIEMVRFLDDNEWATARWENGWPYDTPVTMVKGLLVFTKPDKESFHKNFPVWLGDITNNWIIIKPEPKFEPKFEPYSVDIWLTGIPKPNPGSISYLDRMLGNSVTYCDSDAEVDKHKFKITVEKCDE